MKLIAILLLLLPLGLMAQSVVGSETSEVKLVKQELTKYNGMVPSTWQFFVVPENRWAFETKLAKVDTDLAFTELRFGRTWINAKRLRPDYRVGFSRIIANEVAHIFCNDTNEARTDGVETFRILNGMRSQQAVCH